LTTATNDAARRTGAKGKAYPYVDKKQVQVKIYMPNYEISGNENVGVRITLIILAVIVVITELLAPSSITSLL
jgi:hypothetical protein